jgi:putative Mg2+ transporter-C (MgtC) family protein
MVLGVTPAATLWFATVVGLCLGGGQLILGCVSTVLGYLALTALRWFERKLEEYEPATLVLISSESAVEPAALRARLEAAKFRIKSLSVDHSTAHQRQKIRCEVRWPSTQGAAGLPPVLDELRKLPGLIHLGWRAVGTGPN